MIPTKYALYMLIASLKLVAPTQFDAAYLPVPTAVPAAVDQDQGCGYLTNPGVDANDIANWFECTTQGLN